MMDIVERLRWLAATLEAKDIGVDPQLPGDAADKIEGQADVNRELRDALDNLRTKFHAQAAEIERLRNVLGEIRVYVNEGTFSRQETIEYITGNLNETG